MRDVMRLGGAWRGPAAMAGLAAVFAAVPATAQGEGGASTVSFFQQFFLPGDALGLVVVWLLILMSFVSLSYTGVLILTTSKKKLMPPELLQRLEDLLTSNSTEKFRQALELTKQSPAYLAKLTGAALREAPQGYSAMELAIVEAADAETAKALRPLEYLNVLGNIAPMLGLFGTVYGMIAAFQTLVSAGGTADPAELAAGIGTALVTTFWGLVVAIPALASYAVLRNRVDANTADGVVEAERLIRPFKRSKSKSKSKSGSSSGSGGSSSESASDDDEDKRAADGSMMGGSMMGRPVPNPE
ncbi:MAG: MotA/TolQ/ExbB proton channel family protein [Planctomycetota bacterium]